MNLLSTVLQNFHQYSIIYWGFSLCHILNKTQAILVKEKGKYECFRGQDKRKKSFKKNIQRKPIRKPGDGLLEKYTFQSY